MYRSTILIGLTALIGCRSRVASIDVTPQQVELGRQRAERVELKAIPRDAGGRPVKDVELAFSSSDSEIAEVDPLTGLVMGTGKSGDAFITVAVKNGDQKTIVPVHAKVARSIKLTAGEALLLMGLRERHEIQLEVLNERRETMADPPLTWESLDQRIATVDEKGVVTSTGFGNTPPQQNLWANCVSGSGRWPSA